MSCTIIVYKSILESITMHDLINEHDLYKAPFNYTISSLSYQKLLIGNSKYVIIVTCTHGI